MRGEILCGQRIPPRTPPRKPFWILPDVTSATCVPVKQRKRTGFIHPIPGIRDIFPGPGSGTGVLINKQFPADAQGTFDNYPVIFSKRNFVVDIHGLGGIDAAHQMQSIRKTKITAAERIHSLPRRFFVFGLPVDKFLFISPSFVRKSQCATSQFSSQAGVQRRISSGAGYRGRGAPCPRLSRNQQQKSGRRFLRSVSHNICDDYTPAIFL